MCRDRQTVGLLGVRRCGLTSLDTLQRAAEPTDREQVLPEAKAGVHQLGPDVFDVGIDSCHRCKVLDGFATPERHRFLQWSRAPGADVLPSSRLRVTRRRNCHRSTSTQGGRASEISSPSDRRRVRTSTPHARARPGGAGA